MTNPPGDPALWSREGHRRRVPPEHQDLWNTNASNEGRTCPRLLRAREVLDLHADLHRLTGAWRTDPQVRELFEGYAQVEVQGFPQWQASHLHPATSMDDLTPWLASLSHDLFGATTYQVTAEMIDLATALEPTKPGLEDITEEELPAPWGFMWLDKPIPRPSEEDGTREPLLMHAISWAQVGAVPVAVPEELAEGWPEDAPRRGWVPGVRIREWGWNDSPDIWPRPLHLMGQSTTLLGRGFLTPLPELKLVHMLWVLMGMEIVATTPVRADRAGRRRASNLQQHQVQVVTLRRKARDPDAPPRHVDWTCTWLVRGHWRYPACERCRHRRAAHPHQGCDRYVMPAGRERRWIKPYIKGPEGLPLRANDILYKLAR